MKTADFKMKKKQKNVKTSFVFNSPQLLAVMFAIFLTSKSALRVCNYMGQCWAERVTRAAVDIMM